MRRLGSCCRQEPVRRPASTVATAVPSSIKATTVRAAVPKVAAFTAREEITCSSPPSEPSETCRSSIAL